MFASIRWVFDASKMPLIFISIIFLPTELRAENAQIIVPKSWQEGYSQGIQYFSPKDKNIYTWVTFGKTADGEGLSLKEYGEEIKNTVKKCGSEIKYGPDFETVNNYHTLEIESYCRKSKENPKGIYSLQKVFQMNNGLYSIIAKWKGGYESQLSPSPPYNVLKDWRTIMARSFFCDNNSSNSKCPAKQGFSIVDAKRKIDTLAKNILDEKCPQIVYFLAKPSIASKQKPVISASLVYRHEKARGNAKV